MTGPLPIWVIELVAAIERSEDEHPTYYGDFFNGMHKLEKCPQQEFLELIPEDVRATARRWSA